MLGEHTPIVLLRRSLNALLLEVPRIREGTEQGFHQGRVAIRRIRELLAILRHRYDDATLDGVEARLARAARVLGRARDADVALRLIQHVESRFVPASALLAQLRAAVAAEQLNFRRRAIKELESVDLSALPEQLFRRPPRALRRVSSGWRSALRDHIVGRACELRSAMEHAGGVYFPNRVHAARIAMKHLRYALEVAKTTRTFRVRGGIRTLRQAQDALGEAHDREMLLQRIGEARTQATSGDTALEQFLRAEVQTFHAAYLKYRRDVLTICDACQRGRTAPGVNRWLLAASIALPSLLLARRTSAPTAKRDDEVAERRFQVTVP